MSVELLYQPNLPKIIFSTKAISKMITYLKIPQLKDIEFMFLGEVTKENNLTYHINNIDIAPQTASGATVETGGDAKQDEEYNNWLTNRYKTPQERISVRLHGHSHVNMGVTPSTVDNNLMSQLMENTPNFFIQLIINLQGQYTLNLFSKEDNLIYRNIIMYTSINGILVKQIKLFEGEIVLPPDFKISNYQCAITDNVLIINNNLEFNFNTKTFNAYDNNLILLAGNLIINDQENLLKELEEDAKLKIHYKFKEVSKEKPIIYNKSILDIAELSDEEFYEKVHRASLYDNSRINTKGKNKK